MNPDGPFDWEALWGELGRRLEKRPLVLSSPPVRRRRSRRRAKPKPCWCGRPHAAHVHFRWALERSGIVWQTESAITTPELCLALRADDGDPARSVALRALLKCA